MSKTPWTAFGSTVRVEPGPRKVVARATAELLADDKTATHYHLPRELANGSVAVARDAEGREIQEGQDFTYLDWLGHADPNNAEGTVYYVYRLQDVPVLDAGGNQLRDESGAPRTEEKWVEVAVEDTEAKAHTRATKLAGRS